MGVTADVIETTIHESVLTTIGGTKTVQNTSVNFVALGVKQGDILELGEGLQVGVFRIELVSTNTLTLRKQNDFVATEQALTYRIQRQQLRIQTLQKTRGSSIEVTSSPSELGVPTEIQYGSIPYFEAIDRQGNLLEWAGLVPGDLLKIRGTSVEVAISDIDGTTLNLEEGLSSGTNEVGFEVRSLAAKEFNTMQEELSTFTTNRNLLPRNKFDESVDIIDVVLTTALLPGRNFIANRNNARRLVADLLSLLTDSPRRSDEYEASVPSSFLNLEAILEEFDAAPIIALDSIMDALLERKFDRAVDLLRSGDFEGFYGTNDETGSYAGALISASRNVVSDLPNENTLQYRLDREINTATAELDDLDPEIDFSDTEDEYEIDG